ncbi:poly-gamma-glutamate system protein [Nitratireductor sp. StC3]|uniref:poly-gamma-glutamate system protein n=1 Tax=Nitratireductor sp. StC3 TaxID=2126741 RepID=UPI001304DCDE|nr:poly-gamma-glutamate system protein [Nitratireductor sp. StC3]
MVVLTMHASTPIRYAGHEPLSPTPFVALAVAAALSVAMWQLVEARLGRLTHPAHGEMVRAAQKMQAATQVARAQRAELGLSQPPAFDPNRTGLLGSEFTETTTSLGDPAAKRTATNPDLAAALVGRIAELELARGTPVLVVVSGSFIGANIAAIAAVETLGLKPVLISSLGASMHGATDAALTWLDIETELRAKGVIAAKSIAAVIGGGGGVGGTMGTDGIAALRAAARRHGVPLVENRPVEALIDRLYTLGAAAAGDRPGLLINSGGSVAALGTCANGATLPPMTRGQVLTCTDGTPGLIVRASNADMPVLHLLNMRALAADWGLPFDPVPLPMVGNNRAVYGMPPKPRQR